MIKQSLWTDNIKVRALHRLNKNIKTDILIIGGGIAGISTAFNLKNSNQQITLVDSYKIGFGVSSKNTGKVTFFQGYYNKIKDIYDNDTALLYLRSQKEAIKIIKNNILNYNIKCHFKGTSSYLFADSEKGIKELEKEEAFFTENNIKIANKKSLPIKFPLIKAIALANTAVFHPVKYILALKEELRKKKNIKLYENTPIIKVKKTANGYIAYTEKYTIETNKIILCCHYPFSIIDGYIPFKTTIEKSFLTASKTSKPKSFSAINMDSFTYSISYFDDEDDYILFLSNSNSLNKNMDNEKKYQDHINLAKKYFDHVNYAWSNHDIITSDYLPFIGALNKNLFIATGFNTWGMTNGVIAGKLLSDLLLNKDNNYINLFNPKRSLNIKVLSYNIKNGLNYINSKLNNSIEPSPKVEIIEYQGEKYGVYTDENKKRHYVKNICPHMKCNLIFNNVEKTWDCACHGSRFDIDGNVIQGPAVDNIK